MEDNSNFKTQNVKEINFIKNLESNLDKGFVCLLGLLLKKNKEKENCC